MPELDKNHEHLSESGPYGSVWADIQPESIPQGLGSLWDTSRALKPPGKIKNLGFRGLGEIPPIPPYFPGLGNSILSTAVRCRGAHGIPGGPHGRPPWAQQARPAGSRIL